MEIDIFNMIVTIVAASFASTGFWAFIQYMVSTRKNKDNAETEMIRGLGHDRICYLGESYIKKGQITSEELDSLDTYLYQPYLKLGGNGTAKRIMEEVHKLPIVSK